MIIKTKRNAGLLNSSSLFVLGTASVLLGSGPAQAFDANSLPTGGSVTGGSATIATSGNTLTVNQSSNRAIIDWRNFNIGANAQANFVQPGTSSIAVNRVNGSTDPSRIDGGLHANGQVWVLNPNGVFFGKTARVDAAGVVATTANINDKAFMAGSNKLQMTGGDNGQVVNEGHISVGEGGLAAFVAPSVRNSGTIRARLGKVTLAAGDTYTLDLAGDRLVEIGLGSNKAVVDQSGKIVNAGGVIEISAKAAGQVVDGVINTSGVTDASSVRSVGGKIVLGADVINVAADASLKADGTSGGQITAVANKTGNYAGSYSAQGTTGDGGQIETSGHTVTVASNAKLSAASAHGKAGKWTLDPENLVIDTGVASTTQDTLNNNTDVELSTANGTGGGGDISLQTAINATGTGNLTLTGRHLSTAGGSDVVNIGGALTLNVNAVNASATPSGSWINDALKMIGSVSGGSTVNLGAGTYTVAPGGYVSVGLSNVTINGAGEANTIIDARNASSYGIRVIGGTDSVTLENFTLWGVTASGGYGVKAENTTNLNINNVTSKGAYKAQFDLNGVRTASLDSLIADGNAVVVGVGGSHAGAAIAITDSQDLTLEDSSTQGGSYGGVGIYQSNKASGYTYQAKNITIASSNTFAESNPVYMEDESATNNFGAVTVAGFGYAAHNNANAADTFTYFQNSAQGAIDALDTVSAISTGSVEGWTGTAGDNTFIVGHSTGGNTMSIQAAINAAGSGGTVNVNSGTYNEALSITTAGLTLHSVDPHDAIIDAGGDLTAVSVSTAANLGTITIDGFTIQGWTSRGINQDYHGWSADTAAMHVTNNIVYGPATVATAHGNGIEVSGNDSEVTGNKVYNVHLDSTEWSGSGIIAVNGSHITIANNIVDGADTGIAVGNWDNVAGMSDITVSGNTASHASEGISVQTFLGDVQPPTASGPISSVTITGNTLIDNDSGVGIWDYGTAHNADWATTIADISGNTFTNNAYQISTDLNGADVTPLLNGNHFDRSVTNSLGGNTIYGDLQTAINYEAANSTLDLAGTFSGGVLVNKDGDTLQGQTGALMNVATGQDGIQIWANNVTVKGLEIAGPADQSYLTYSWGSANSRGIVVEKFATDFLIADNNIHGTRNDILVDGRNTGSITNNVIDNSKSGISVQYTDGTAYDKSLDSSGAAVVLITGNSQGPNGNEWGINYHLNGYWNGVAGDELHPNSNPVLTHTYLANAPSAAWQQGILDQSAANGGMTIQDQAYASSNRTAVTVSATGNDANQGSPLNSLATISAGINAVVTGGTVNVNDGAYTLADELDINKSLTLKGQSEAGTEITSNSLGYGINVTADNVSLQNFTYHGPTDTHGATYGIKVTPDTNAISDRLLNFDIENVTIDRGYRTGLDLNGVVGATISNVNVSNIAHGNGIALTDSANVTLTNNTTSGNAWGGLALYQTNHAYDQQVNNISVDASNSFNDTIPVYAEDQSSGTADPQSVVGGNGLDFGAITLAGFDYVVKSPNDANDVYSWFQKTQQGAINFATDAALGNGNVNLASATVQGYSGTGVDGDNHFTVGIGANGAAMSVNVALDQSATGGIVDVLNGTYAEDVAITAPRTVNFDNATLDSLSVSATGGGSALSGSVKAGSVTAFDINLGGDLSLDTSAAGGTIALANVDGAHNLTLNAGSGVVLAGGLGATTRLGAVDITADLIGLGATNKAASFDFNGDVALSAASTVIDTTVSNTAAGDITFAGDIFGFTDGGQSLTLAAGPGTGAKSANGDIAMNNAGLSTLRLGSMTVSGDDFTALTVDLAGGFTSQLTGNQLFAADTLNAAGDVNSNVAGNIGGHIVSGGNVNLTAAGNVSGDITGKVVSLTGQTVNSQVTANTLNVNAAQGGTITGTFTPGTVSNGLVVNGTTVGSNTGTGNTGTGNTGTGNTGTGNTGTGNTGTGNTGTGNTGTGDTGTGNTGTGNTGTGNTGTGNTANNFPNVNLQQLVVEGFALPVGTQIGANGQLILPAGTVLGLLSPGGGTPRVIMVQTVQELGALLDQGYSAIVIDLTGHKKATKVASN